MKKYRIIYLVSLISVIVYASFFGGYFTYAMLYTVIAIPFISILYTWIVYNQFRIYQEIPVRQVTKNVAIPYILKIENNFIFSFAKIKLSFFNDVAEIKDINLFSEHKMLPKTNKSFKYTLVPKYRGTYYMGVEYLEVTDIFYLMRIKYKIPTMTRISVKPRILELKNLSIGIDSSDSKKLNQNLVSEECELSNETKKYTPGDNLKRIHWKNVAKTRELVTKKIENAETYRSLLIMDLRPVKDVSKRIVIEDKIIESALAIANNFLLKKIEIFTLCVYKNKQLIDVNSSEKLKMFLDYCSHLKFNSNKSYCESINDVSKELDGKKNYIIITNKIETTKMQFLKEQIMLGNKINIVYISSDDIKIKNSIENIDILSVLFSEDIEESLVR